MRRAMDKGQGILLAGLVASLLAGLLSACGQNDTQFLPPPAVQVGTLSAQPVAWSAQQQMLGHVMAVADVADQIVVFSDAGAFMFSGGSLNGTDNSVTSFRAAAAVPALGVPGTWVVGVDGKGRVFRVRNNMVLDEVTQIYALSDHPVGAVVPLGGAQVAFALAGSDAKVAVADGKSLALYPLAPRGLAGGGGRLAVLDDQGVQVLTVADRSLRHFDLPGVLAAAFDPDGHLVVATAQALYQEQGPDLNKVFDSPDPVSGLSASSSGTWVAMGSSLALLRGSQLLRGPAGQVPAGAQLSGSPSGDVWLIAAGQLSRIGEVGGASADEAAWRQTMLPIFDRVCRQCHLPGGIANIDLSTFASWASRRALIGQRVLDGKPTPMPPAGTGGLTAAEKTALGTWVNSPAK